MNPCISAVEAVSAARELTPETPDRDLRELLTYLEVATENCFNEKKVADAWYFRGLLEQRLDRNSADADYSIKKADDAGSTALTRKLNPFVEPETPSETVSPTIREKWALVVGVSSFADTSIPPLQYTRRDAELFAQTLSNPEVGRFNPENVRVLVDNDATLENIRRGLGWIRDNASKDDLVVFYLSSHGSARETRPNGVSYVLTHDSDMSDGGSVYATSLSMSDIVDTLNKDVLARRVVVFLDTCYSGAAAPGVAPPGSKSFTLAGSGAESVNGVFSRIKNGIGWAVIAASRGDQQSFESDDLQNGYFTHYLIDAMREDQGSMNVQQIFEQLKSQVSTQVREEKQREQTPVMSTGGEGSEIVLGAPSDHHARLRITPRVEIFQGAL